MKYLLLSFFTVFVVFTTGCAPQTFPEADKGLTSTFVTMLENSMDEADLVAHVEVTGFELEERDGGLFLYRVQAKILESFKGQHVESIVFYQWIEEDPADEDVTGARVIVALKKSEESGEYIVPFGGSSFPDFDTLLDVARKEAAAS